MGSSYQALHHTRQSNGTGPILTYPDLETATEEVERMYPDFRITAVIPLNLSDDTEYIGIGGDDSYPIQVYLGPKEPEKMTPEVRENTRLFWIECGFDQHPLRKGRVKGEIKTVIQALLVDEIRPINLCRLDEEGWDKAMSPYVEGADVRAEMRLRFFETLECDD
ncbi:hypothetical protein KC571_03380 [candidate division WWE3 bacterium]|uniref:Uncharacterized protein n=1 Tax=candidate division WWE3 bacterium TaxID=2053526 RepID=A0A955LGZ6_UNCKA|nr:hypothetical protein [candidate division WWE3 bacterium]